VPINEAFGVLAQIVVRIKGSLQDLQYDVFRHVPGPALRGIEGDDAESVAVLAGQEIADDGFTIGLGGIGLVISDAVLAVVILYQVSGDIVRRLKHAAGHGAHQGLDSIPVPLGPRRGIDDFTAQWRAAIRPAPVPLGL
jgi:hypothetical protein